MTAVCDLVEKSNRLSLESRYLAERVRSNYSKARDSYVKCVAVFNPKHPAVIRHRRPALDPDVERLWPGIVRMMERDTPYNSAFVRRYLLLLDRAIDAGIKTVHVEKPKGPKRGKLLYAAGGIGTKT